MKVYSVRDDNHDIENCTYYLQKAMEERSKFRQEGVKWASVNTGTDAISMCGVPIKVQYGTSGKIQETHALLDNRSQGTFISERLINNLGVKGQKMSVTTKTLNGEVTNKAMVVKGFKVTSGNCRSNDYLKLSDIYIPRSTYQLTKKML